MTSVLIIEDNVDLSTLFQTILALDNIPAKICRDGREAMALIEAVNPKIILLDMHVPHISGATIFAHVQENYPETQVIIITADIELYGEYRKQTRTFLKPMDLNILRHEVGALL